MVDRQAQEAAARQAQAVTAQKEKEAVEQHGRLAESTHQPTVALIEAQKPTHGLHPPPGMRLPTKLPSSSYLSNAVSAGNYKRGNEMVAAALGVLAQETEVLH